MIGQTHSPLSSPRPALHAGAWWRAVAIVLLCAALLLATADTGQATARPVWKLIDFSHQETEGRKHVVLWLLGEGDFHVPGYHPIPPLDLRPLLSIECLPDGSRDLFIHQVFDLDSDSIPVRYSFDGGPTRDATWLVEGNSFRPPDKKAFERELLGGRDLSFTLLPRGAEATTSRFLVAGLNVMITPLRRLCGWP